MISAAVVAFSASAQPQYNGVSYLMNGTVDVSADFNELGNVLFLAERLDDFDVETAEGKVIWQRNRLVPRQAFNTNIRQPDRLQCWTSRHRHM